jgi:hypothetical protein
MDVREDFLRSLLNGLPQEDQSELLHSIQEAHGDQLDRKRHPRARRRRDANGELVMPEQGTSADELTS